MVIADDKPNVMFMTEVILKNQINPITRKLVDIKGYKCSLNFDPASGIRGVAIYSRISLKLLKSTSR